MSRFFLSLGALLSAMYVMLGAYASHGIKPHISEELYTVFQTGLHYHIIHSLALILIGILLKFKRDKLTVISGFLMIAGISFFSCSLYLYAGFGFPVSFLTPFGGMSFIFGWLVLFISTVRKA